MNFIRDFFQLTGKRKFLVCIAIFAWYLSISFSKDGFSLKAPNMAWIGWVLGMIITAVELAFNDRTQKQTLTITLIGMICYGYGVWTNVTGFWSVQNPGVPFVPFDQASILAWFVGLILEILPEPLFMFAIGRAQEADPFGALADVTSGKIGDLSKPVQQNNQNQNRHQEQRQNQDRQGDLPSAYRPAQQDQGKPKQQENQASPLMKELFARPKNNNNRPYR